MAAARGASLFSADLIEGDNEWANIPAALRLALHHLHSQQQEAQVAAAQAAKDSAARLAQVEAGVAAQAATLQQLASSLAALQGCVFCVLDARARAPARPWPL